MRRPIPFLTALLLGLSVSPAFAQTLTGLVVDSQGNPVAGVDIDVINEGSGGDPTVSGDFTDANGVFNVSVTPGGVYNVRFVPPPPNFITQVVDVNVSGVVDMGTIVVPPGVTLSGACVDSGGLPLGGVNLDVIDQATGVNLELSGDVTDPSGEFELTVPVGDLEVRFDATPVTFKLVASKALELTTTADLDLGTLVFPDGYRITTIVQGPGFTPVVDADTDVNDLVTGDTLYTPKDNTNASGFVSVVVPAGTYEFEICPKFQTGLVAQVQGPLAVAADVNLGLTTLSPGVALQGTVTATVGGAPIQGVDLDVRDSVSKVLVPTCNDNTNGAGQYAVIVPPGTYDLEFAPKFSQPYEKAFQTGVTVAGATVVNATLDDCAYSTPFGVGKAGSGGFVPALGSSGGTPRLGNTDYAIELSGGLGGQVAILILGFGPGALPFKGGTIYVDLGLTSFTFALPLSGPAGVPGAGALTLPAAVPVLPGAVGQSAYLQFVLQDPGVSPFSVAMSHGLQVTFCD